jgi:toxin ParE1/3/4
MARVRFTKPAINDLSEIGSHIAKDNERISREFIARIKDKCYSISSSPYMGRQRDDYGPEVRSFPFGNYVIFYKPINPGIAILHILHGARNLPEIFEEEK